MFPHQFVRVSIRRIWWKVKEPKPAAKTCNECLGLLRNMGWTTVNDEENTVLGANHQPPEKLDENTGVDAAFFLDHEPHMAARSHRRDQTHVVSRPRTQHNRCLSLLCPRSGLHDDPSAYAQRRRNRSRRFPAAQEL